METSAIAERGRGQARSGATGKAVETAARAGFVARGVIYLLIGVLALRVAFPGDSGGGEQADRGGALKEVAEQPLGGVLLWLLGIGLVGMALWRLSEALFGQAGPDGQKPMKRIIAAGRCVFYAFVAYSVISYAAGDKGSGSGSSDKRTDDVTAKVLDWSGGQWLVGIAGAVVVGVGLWLIFRAVTLKFRKHLDMSGTGEKVRRTVDAVGVFGGTARGVVFGTAGGFAIAAAVQHEPGQAKGMDDTLRSFTDTPAGPWLLVLVALGLAAFGVFSWANARWRKV
ncbi:DUF1206 domain-containing protein [Streptomyces sp. NPDC060198]|uniref:DUF1206 domain-containing protein n=1 Tax=Streptomyces sp. NPDC060198 TaxID=3347070 RepID=UPI00365799C4